MKIPDTISYEKSELEIIDEIENEGTILLSGQWKLIDTFVQVYKETDKAYFGTVTVFECDESGDRVDELFFRENTWIPKSMSDNPWWICTVMFDHPDKVSNKRFQNDY